MDRSITEGPIVKRLLLFAFPIFASNFFQQMYNIADAAVLGNFVGEGALAAVSETGYVVNILIGFFLGLGVGAGILISQRAGAGDREGLSKAVHTCIALCLCAGAAMTFIGIGISPWMLRLINTPADVMDYGVTYLRIYFIGTVPVMIYNLGGSILRGIGDSKRPFYYLVVSSLLNVALDLLFVAGFHQGVAGAAWATVLSQSVSAFLILRRLLRTDEAWRLFPGKLRFHAESLKQILRIGVPAGMQMVIGQFAHLIMQTQINSFGSGAMAGIGAGSKINNFILLPIEAVGLALSTFTGQNFGAGKPARAYRSTRACAALTSGGALLLSGLVWIGMEPLIRIFTQEPYAVGAAVVFLSVSVPFYAFYAVEVSIAGSLRGAGYTAPPMLFNLVFYCGLRVFLMLAVMPLWHDIRLIGICYPASWLASSTANCLYYRFGNWRNRWESGAFSQEKERGIA